MEEDRNGGRQGTGGEGPKGERKQKTTKLPSVIGPQNLCLKVILFSCLPLWKVVKCICRMYYLHELYIPRAWSIENFRADVGLKPFCFYLLDKLVIVCLLDTLNLTSNRRKSFAPTTKFEGL
jgi:hypothetical protein